jgi:hypothetical protein
MQDKILENSDCSDKKSEENYLQDFDSDKENLKKPEYDCLFISFIFFDFVTTV